MTSTRNGSVEGKAVVTVCALGVALGVMLATGLQGGWAFVDTAFFVGLWLMVAGVFWWERRKGTLNAHRMMQLSLEFAGVLLAVWVVTRIFEYNEVLGFITLAVAFVALSSWRAWRAKLDSGQSGQVASVDQRRP